MKGKIEQEKIDSPRNIFNVATIQFALVVVEKVPLFEFSFSLPDLLFQPSSGNHGTLLIFLYLLNSFLKSPPLPHISCIRLKLFEEILITK